MVKHMSKGQVSLEYLMTYGIAIAIVVIAVAALYSMGVFKSSSSSTPPCANCFSDFAETNYNPHTGYMELELKNGPQDITTVDCGAPACNITYGGITNGTIYKIDANAGFVLVIGGDSTNGATVTMSYTKSGSTLQTTRTQTIGKDYFR